MSEYQYVAFRAVDAPLNDEQLTFANEQSSHAEVSRWSLVVEYNYSEFHGDVDGLLRQGFDVFLQYANYGTRKIKLRLPHGMPFAKRVWSTYMEGRTLQWEPDAKGHGGILTLDPFLEAGDFDDVWELQEYLDDVVRVRNRLLRGDLRALYLLWLGAVCDEDHIPEETIEPPVPHGIAEIADDGGELLWFFGADPLLLVAAGEDVGPAPADDAQDRASRWVNALGEQPAKDLLLKLLTGDTASVKAGVLADIRDAQDSGGWPTSDKRRSLEQLLERAEELRAEQRAKEARKAQEKAKRKAAKAARQRAERMKEMVAEPQKWIREAKRLAKERGTDNYEAAANILADLRDAVGGDKGVSMAHRCAVDLAKQYPTLNRLKSALRKRGLLA
ncbi:hypothetical protein Pan216_56490 [Planctomycetes bacterium Pan216]|uniref:Uncharacterized protein n=1 Tax=Kolteria novifilia TaxID=2527975 RepID=A0A518BCR7_9BACT|nr:hypothetical protein Pan216_56490 [Planctomycetes bacterium Pan216]